jgi:Txe/YoeB family toxin of Txe-Axe toxin-antitoxin module
VGLSKKLISLFILFLGLHSQALDCRIVEKFSDPQFANNTKFWNELGQLEDQTDDAVAALIKKHDTNFKFSSSNATAPKTFSIPQSFSISKKSEKAMKTFSPSQQKNFEEFVSTVSGKDGAQALYNNPGKWHYEKLKQYGGNSSIRLDSGMRVLFKVDGDAVEILDVGKHIGH